jgi:hypothetical protein
VPRQPRAAVAAGIALSAEVVLRPSRTERNQEGAQYSDGATDITRTIANRHGEAWKRIGFLRDLLEEDVENGLTPMGRHDTWPWSRISGARDGKVTYLYLGEHQPNQLTTGLPKDEGRYAIDIIDTWNMTVTPARRIPPIVPHPTRHGGVVRGGKPDAAFGVELPGKPYLAIRVRSNLPGDAQLS